MESGKFVFEKYGAPEESGIPSGSVLNFLNRLEEKKLCMHSIMIVRHNKIVMEAHYPPFSAETLHRMYSVTKSFVSVAIGFMIDEGKITLQSKLIDLFPEYKNDAIYPYQTEMTVRDLLLMATPYEKTTYAAADSNWARTFFTAKPTHSAGAVFNYDTSGTVTLNALVEKISGQNLIDYLRTRLFEPLGFSKDVWCVERPEGGAWGGSGLLCSVYDLAKFGLFLLNRGKWQGAQLLSASYLMEACSPLIDNRTTVMNPEMQFGYGYQIWQARHNSFCAWGMGSQLALCIPEKDMVLVTTGDTQSVSAAQDIIFGAFWNDVYPFITEKPLNENDGKSTVLAKKLENTEFPRIDGENVSPLQNSLHGKKYKFGDNNMKIKNVVFEFSYNRAVMKYENSSGVHEIQFGLGVYLEGVFPETQYFDKKIGVPSGKGYRYKASGSWFNSQSLTFYVYIIDNYFGTLKVNCFFEEDSLTLHMVKAAEWFLDEYQGMATGKTVD